MKSPGLAVVGLLAVSYFMATAALERVSNILLLRPAVIPIFILSNACNVIYYWLVYQIFKGINRMFSVDQVKIKTRAEISTVVLGTAFLFYIYIAALTKQFWFFGLNGH